MEQGWNHHQTDWHYFLNQQIPLLHLLNYLLIAEGKVFFTGVRVMMAEETLLGRQIFRGLAFGSGAIDSIKEVSGTASRLQPGFDDAGVDVD